MRAYKEKSTLRWATLRRATASLPLLCLVAAAINLPLPLPRALVRETSLDARALGLDGALRAAFGEVREGGGDGPVAGSGPLAPTILLGDEPAPAYAYREAERLLRERGAAVAFKGAGAATGSTAGWRPDAPLSAWSLAFGPDAADAALTLLLSPSAAEAVGLELRVGGRVAAAGSPGTLLEPGRKLRLSLDEAGDRAGATELELAARYADGAELRSTARLLAARDAEPAMLMITERPERRSVLESLYPLRKVSPAELAGLDLRAYELAVLDGVALASLGAAAERGLAEALGRGWLSLLAVADSPEFGRRGDAPLLERLLPVELDPRELKDLPDMALLIVLDRSGSMYGDKLSLAKLTGLETLANLKPKDLVGLVAFSEDHAWVYRFEEAGALDSAAAIAPLAAGGGTRLYPALRDGLEALAAAPRATRHAVIVSDGITEPADFAGLAAWAAARGISVSAVAVAVGEDYDPAALRAMTEGSGGAFYRALDQAAIPSLIVEDRKRASRVAFKEGETELAAYGAFPAGSVSGMALLSPKAGALVSVASEPGDPLLASVELAGRTAAVFSSDLYGRYSGAFFGDETGLGAFTATIGPLLRRGRPAVSLSETADGLHLALTGDGLLAPRLVVSSAAGIEAERDFSARGPGLWSAELAPAPGGPYTLMVQDGGAIVLKLGAYRNGGLGGGTEASFDAARRYRTPLFCYPRDARAWVLLFFAMSLALSAAWRIRP